MKILKSSELFLEIRSSTVFLDTNVLIGLRDNKELFEKIVGELSTMNCTLSTIPQVVFELTRGVSTILKYKNLGIFLSSFNVSIFSIDKYSDEYPDLGFILQKVSKGISYTDHLLCLCLCKFPNSYLLTEDRDIPVTLFDRPYLITIDTDKDIRTYAFYKFSGNKFETFVKLFI